MNDISFKLLMTLEFNLQLQPMREGFSISCTLNAMRLAAREELKVWTVQQGGIEEL